MEPRKILLFRASLAEKDELAVAKKYFTTIESRGEIEQVRGVMCPPAIVIPRYAALPFYKELEIDIDLLGGKMINSYREHQYVADLQNWYPDLCKLTPKTWFRPEEVPRDHPGSFILKGATNSKKHSWSTHMFAKTRADVVPVMCRLLDDTFIGQQSIYVREYEPLQNLGMGVAGLPITNEWRFFILDGEILAEGFYWSEHVDYIFEEHDINVGDLFLGAETFVRDEIIPIVKDNIRFWVVDIGRHQDGRWRVIELNDGQMSGLSCVDPDELYKNMKAMLER